MLTPADEELRKILEEAADDAVNEMDMVLDEGHWVDKLYRRGEDLGMELGEVVQMREVIEEVIALRVAQSMLTRLKVNMEDAAQRRTFHTDDGLNRVFIQGSGWIDEFPRGE